ncbi:amidohydrolase family protein [Allopusillimonas ginsengisoli]|uniref:amidohydrolase family protein n=1 Tax=Allopusillimonas ginsengisoli TaxID=453575 RepID=UPI001020F2F3|nr:amidohydrolase family protein [Allopusillimonas ginsengisoli]TEA79992.1 2-pyrone-4,6-dicarboxylate hydrolase [Allopusillimonas ginsengisoli]
MQNINSTTSSLEVAPESWLDYACDSHLHIFDGRFSQTARYDALIPNATVNDYRKIQPLIGTSRAVIVQAKRYGTDNACLLDALRQLGESARGIAVVAPSISATELRQLNTQGIRGLRFSVWNDADTVMNLDLLEEMAERIADLDWHVQLHMTADQIVHSAALLHRLPCPIVFDHIMRLPPEQGLQHAAWPVVKELLNNGRCWVKLSGAYLNSHIGEPDYPEVSATVATLIRTAPGRLVWGSDWPHVTEISAGRPIATVQLRRLLRRWAPSPQLLRRVLVDNPERLYGFSPHAA